MLTAFSVNLDRIIKRKTSIKNTTAVLSKHTGVMETRCELIGKVRSTEAAAVGL